MNHDHLFDLFVDKLKQVVHFFRFQRAIFAWLQMVERQKGVLLSFNFRTGWPSASNKRRIWRFFPSCNVTSNSIVRFFRSTLFTLDFDTFNNSPSTLTPSRSKSRFSIGMMPSILTMYSLLT